jgi:hypothetical protein
MQIKSSISVYLMVKLWLIWIEKLNTLLKISLIYFNMVHLFAYYADYSIYFLIKLMQELYYKTI